jgi:hypothetical protein
MGIIGSRVVALGVVSSRGCWQAWRVVAVWTAYSKAALDLVVGEERRDLDICAHDDLGYIGDVIRSHGVLLFTYQTGGNIGSGVVD